MWQNYAGFHRLKNHLDGLAYFDDERGNGAYSLRGAFRAGLELLFDSNDVREMKLFFLFPRNHAVNPDISFPNNPV
jgi:hypothetical protein